MGRTLLHGKGARSHNGVAFDRDDDGDVAARLRTGSGSSTPELYPFQSFTIMTANQ